MIKTLEIKNFRTHRHTKLEFVKGINCIIGLPESGKTNIIRSINWLLTNRPLGFRFHSDFTTEPTKVSIAFDNGGVSLNKNKKGAEYRCTGYEKPLMAIGHEVPDVVTNISRMPEFNLQRQLDKPFLICTSPIEVAKVLNRITKLEKPDIAVSSLTTDINTENKKLKMIQTQEIELKEQIANIGDIESMKADFAIIKNIDSKVNDVSNNISELNAVLLLIERHQEELKKFKNIKSAKADFVEIEKVYTEISKIKNTFAELCNVIDEIESGVSKINKLQSIINKTKADIKPIMEIGEMQSKITNSHTKLCTASENAESAAKIVYNTREKLILKAQEYRAFLNTINICPYCSVCKEPISKHNLDDALKGLGI